MVSSDKKFLMDNRFSETEILPPKIRAYFAHILHMLHPLSNKEIMVPILLSSVLFREKPEKSIREYLINKNYIDTIIELLSNIFNGLKRSNIVMTLKKIEK